MRPPSPQQKQAAVDKFNATHQVGASVLVWRGVREGDGEPAQTAGEAYILQGHTPVVHVTGGHGCVALTHVASRS
jgi:hypothetical protein